MSQQPIKETLPPSYEEVMNTSSVETPPVGYKYPNPNVGMTETPNPQQQQQQYYYVPQPPPQPTAPFYQSESALPYPHAVGQVPSYGAFESTPVTVVIRPEAQQIFVNVCPACRVGRLEDSYPCLGLLCALVFFPVGILCCLAMKNKRCTNCDTEF